MKQIGLLFIILLAFAAAFGQHPDQWRGLTLEQSSPEDAIRILGSPTKDLQNQQFRIFGGVTHWISKAQHQKIFRQLYFDIGKNEGIQKANLFFLEGKLVRILLDLKAGEVSPNGLSNIYGIEMFPMIGGMDLAMAPGDFERNQGRIYPKSYPTVYALVGVSEKSFVSAMISNSGFGSIFSKSLGVPDAPNNFPGKVENVDIISRSMENRDGASILK